MAGEVWAVATDCSSRNESIGDNGVDKEDPLLLFGGILIFSGAIFY
jgi:hypothetical protein